MPKLRFTARGIDAVKPPVDRPQEDYWDADTTGFGLRVTRDGRKSWFVKYRVGGRRPRVTFGTYPVLSLADARTEATRILRDAVLGVDAAAVRREERATETFRQLATTYLEQYAKLNKKSWQEDERILNHDILPVLGNVKAKEIRRRDVVELLAKIAARPAPVLANRVLALLSKMFNFAIEHDIVENSPCHGVKKPAKERPRERVLSGDELRSLWTEIATMSPVMRGLFQLMVMTAQRGYEVRSMRKDELDLTAGWWTIPGEKTKNGLTHRVPLPAQTMQLVRKMIALSGDSPWVFPSPKVPLQHIDNIQKAVQRVRGRAGFDYVAHDFRRTVASHMASLGVPRLVISKILNHTEGGITKVYDRHSYDKEKWEGMQIWVDYLFKIVSEPALNKARPGLTTQLSIGAVSARPDVTKGTRVTRMKGLVCQTS